MSLFLLCPFHSWGQDAGSPQLVIEQSKKLDYERPPRLEEEDNNNGTVFQFSRGLEIITDIEYVKVFLFDIESGRTPFESNDVSNGYIRVKLEKPGYRDFSFWVNVKEDYRTTVHVYYKDKPAETGSHTQTGSTNLMAERPSRPVYLAVNPGDPAYYRQIFYLNTLDSESHFSAVLSDNSTGREYQLTPVKNIYPFVFRWDGEDPMGGDLKDGEYTLQMSPGELYSLTLDRTYSRIPASYFSGASGLILAPSAQLLFPGGFQFGSSFTLEKKIENESSGDYSLPFSFFLRFSPLVRWEAAFEGEVAFVNESGEPSLRINSSQKVYILGNNFFHLTGGIRGSYKGAVNDLGQKVQNALVRDPSGFSFFLPVQFDVEQWSFIFSPEFIYSLSPLGSFGIAGEYDLTGSVKWGVRFSDDFLGAGFSTALFFPSYRGNKTIMQTGVEGFAYIPDSPMYISLFGMIQKMKDGPDEGFAAGLNLGFLF
ncbi:MAG: PEGA domain-containing protein [Spirochaetales bacterium]|nr:PEGA domain-containing protein [Spirochaetales bacterium]